jgi:RNA polymerase sigma-70 factor, ECF subfamily
VSVAEHDLLTAACAGDEAAFRQLVEPYRRTLEVHCYRMLGSPHDAEDVVQETLLRAWRNLGRFDRHASVYTWLYRIATNACLDELRRRPRRPDAVQPFPDSAVEQASAPVFEPAARYALREGMELALMQAIQRLPGRQRAVLILRDVLGWTAPEVAALLETTTAAVNSALQRARATVDRHLPDPATRPPAAAERELLARYLDAWERDDVDGLVSLLREDAVLRMPPQPDVAGAGAIATFFLTVATNGRLHDIAVGPAWANGRPAVVMHRRRADGTLHPHGVLGLEVRDERIAALDAWIDPALATRFSS